MKQIIYILEKADSQLEQIAVRGNDAYLMVNARSLLKAAYDALNKPSEEVEDNVPGSDE